MSGYRVLPTVACLTVLALAGCERPPVDTTDLGVRGLGMVHVQNPRIAEERRAEIEAALPQDLPALPPETAQPAAPGTFQNIQVLGNLSVAEVNRTMVAMTNWVSPEVGCNYCHYVDDAGAVNLASDEVYTKTVSRRMIEMVKTINRDYSDHVGETGVTCYTCHVGQPNPEHYWTMTEGDPNQGYFLDREDVRVQSEVPLSRYATTETSIQNTRNTYWFMIHISNSLGVNCTHCHQSARFADWEESPPARVTALRGLRMVRALNQEYLEPLADQLPDSLMGPQGDGPKIECMTCHAGLSIPLYGLSTAADYPALLLPTAVHPTGNASAP